MFKILRAIIKIKIWIYLSIKCVICYGTKWKNRNMGIFKANLNYRHNQYQNKILWGIEKYYRLKAPAAHDQSRLNPNTIYNVIQHLPRAQSQDSALSISTRAPPTQMKKWINKHKATKQDSLIYFLVLFIVRLFNQMQSCLFIFICVSFSIKVKSLQTSLQSRSWSVLLIFFYCVL